MLDFLHQFLARTAFILWTYEFSRLNSHVLRHEGKYLIKSSWFLYVSFALRNQMADAVRSETFLCTVGANKTVYAQLFLGRIRFLHPIKMSKIIFLEVFFSFRLIEPFSFR